MTPVRLVALLLAAALTGGCAAGDGGADRPRTNSPTASSASTPSTGSPTAPPSSGAPLAGKVVVLDPGHQLGNSRHPARITAPVDAGGFEKECNTTGTATNGGYPEATFVWQVAKEVQRQLRRLGARVLLTRDANSAALWGPCVDERGRAGNPGEPGPTADVKVSLHADGVVTGPTTRGGAHGFHVIRPGALPGYTDDIVAPSRLLADAVRDALVGARFRPSSYRGTDGVDVRTDLGTLNLSDVPVVMAELGNMRHPAEAAVMTSAAGRARYARALAAGIREYLAG